MAPMHFFEHKSTRILYVVFGSCLTLGTIAMSLSLPWASMPQPHLAFNIGFLFLLLWAGMWLVMTSLRFRVTLTKHSLVMRRALITRTIERSDIAYYRARRISGAGTTLIIYASGRKRPFMCIPGVIKNDDALIDWLDNRRA